MKNPFDDFENEREKPTRDNTNIKTPNLLFVFFIIGVFGFLLYQGSMYAYENYIKDANEVVSQEVDTVGKNTMNKIKDTNANNVLPNHEVDNINEKLEGKCNIKALVDSTTNQKLYYLPDDKLYKKIETEKMFCSEKEAQDFGYKKSE